MSDRVIRLAVVQPRSIRPESANVKRAVDYARQAADRGAQLIAFPECYPGPYSGPTDFAAGEALAAVAREYAVHIGYGFMEEAGIDDETGLEAYRNIYQVLGTDKYPPFTLQAGDYPADLEVEYPEKLSRGLVLVKWWLLAIPHYVIIAIFQGGGGGRNGPGLTGILVLIAAIVLLFTGKYRQDLFDLVVGLNRWTYRVYAYVALMTDDYPPFRLWDP